MLWRLKQIVARSAPTAARVVRTFIDIEHDGAVHRVAIKRVGSARRLSLRVRTARQDVVLTMPVRCSFALAERFARRHAAWIADRLDALAPPVAFTPGSRIPVRGLMHVTLARPGLRRRVWTEIADDGPQLCVSGPEGAFAAQVGAFLRAEAQADLTDAVTRYAAQAGVSVSGLTLRDTRSRWGSCTARGALNFSWRLILAPPFVLDYLAAHEVAHRVHLDHSDQFWALVRRLYPEIETAEAWLKQHGASLHRYGGVARAPTTVGGEET